MPLPLAESFVAPVELSYRIAESYIDIPPSNRGDFATHCQGYLDQDSDSASELKILVDAAKLDMLTIYDPAYSYLSERGIPDDQIERIMANSKQFGQHFGAMGDADKRYVGQQGRTHPEAHGVELFETHRDEEGVIDTINFTREGLAKFIKPHQGSEIGCTLIGMNLADRHNGTRLALYGMYWSALVPAVHRRYLQSLEAPLSQRTRY